MSPTNPEITPTRRDFVAVCVNVEEGHANCNTVSLFVNGERAVCDWALGPRRIHFSF